MQVGEVWFAQFPYEEDVDIVKPRPVIIAQVEPLEVLSVKVTTHDIRDSDEFDIPIIHWEAAGLRQKSVARVSKTIFLSPANIDVQIGTLHPDDKAAIMLKLINYLQTL